MAYTAPTAVTAGDALTASGQNILVNNDIAMRAAAVNIQSTCLTTATTVGAGAASTWYDFTGFTVTITPTASNSKILVFGQVLCGSAAGALTFIKMLRGSTDISVGTGSLGSRLACHSGAIGMNDANDNWAHVVPFSFLDSPSTTSATTYKLQVQVHNASQIYMNRTYADGDVSYQPRGVSTITAIEVPA